MIHFKKLRYKNFISTGNDFIEISLDINPTTVVIGYNGAGKTTFIDALTFALYGRAFRNINKPLLVNSITKEQCLCEVEFTIGSINYLVKRGIKPTVFEIYRNSTMLNQDSGAKDYQMVLERTILKMNFKAFSQVVVLGSKTYVPFMRLVASDRRTVVDDLLDTQTYSTMSVLFKQDLKDLEPIINTLGNNINHFREKLVIQEKHVQHLTKNNEELIAKNNEAIEKCEHDIKEMKAKIADYSIDYNKPELADPIQKKIDELVTLKTKLDHKVSHLNREMTFFTSNDICSTCHQPINESFKTNAVNTRHDKLIELKNASDEIKKLLAEANDKKNQNQQDWIAYRVTEREINDLNLSISGTESWINKLQLINEGLQQKDGNLDEAIAQKDKFKQSLQDAENQYKETIEQYNYLEYAILILKDSGIKSSIIRQYVPIINKMINKYLSLIEFSVNFSINEQFEEKLYSRFRDEFSYENFSDGEKLRIDLAILYAWREVAKQKNSIDTNLLIMDEILDSSLDVFGVEEFFTMLQSMDGSNMNLFVISHKGDVLADKFDSTIRFEKKNDFSEIVE